MSWCDDLAVTRRDVVQLFKAGAARHSRHNLQFALLSTLNSPPSASTLCHSTLSPDQQACAAHVVLHLKACSAASLLPLIMNQLAVAVVLLSCFAVACANAQPFDNSGAQFAPRLSEVCLHQAMPPQSGRFATRSTSFNLFYS